MTKSDRPNRGRMPAGACDTHVHVFDPACFPYASGRAYTPGEASLQGLTDHMESLGTERCVVVQPSVYGSDNSCLLSALAHLGRDKARGVAVVEEDVGDTELVELQTAGVRAVRVNFEAAGSASLIDRTTVIQRISDRIRGSGLAVQLYVDTATAVKACEQIAGRGVPVILDHFAGFKCGMDVSDEVFLRLLDVLKSDTVWVKLSAPYRTGSLAENYEDLRPAAQAMIAAAPDRMIWASDWPHTGGGASRAQRIPEQIEPFRAVDDVADLERLRAWVDDDGLYARILAENPARLFEFI